MTTPRLMGAALAASLATLAVGQVLPWDTSVHERYQRLFYALTAEGQPEEGENALQRLAAFRQRATDVMRPWPFEAGVSWVRRDLPCCDPDLDPGQLQALRRALAAHEAAGLFSDIAAIAAAPRAVPYESAGPLTEQGGWLAGAAYAAWISRARACEAVRAGDGAAAVARWREALIIARQAAKPPMLITMLIAVGQQSVTFASIREVVAAGGLDEEALIALDAAIVESDLEPIGRAFRGELLIGLDTVDAVYASGAELRLTRGRRAGEQAAMIHRVNRMFELEAGMTTAERYDAEDARERDLDQLKQGSELAKILIPSVGPIMTDVDRWRADQAGLRVLIALERYRLAQGAEPVSLAVLVPRYIAELPRDPYTGGPLRYAPPFAGPEGGRYAGGRRFLLYVPGPDLRDDRGGVPSKRSKSLGLQPCGYDLILNDGPPRAR